MLKKYLIIFLVSMVPLIELRGAVPIAVGMNLPLLPSYIVCILGNMLPVPFIFFFARKVLEWGADKPVIGKFFTFCLEKGHKGGQKLQENREKDLRMKQTMTGPHRDDLGFAVHGVDLRKYGSQGQQRTTALSLKLAEIEIVKQSVKDTPVLLLDDVLSELDGSRQRYLLENIHDIQTMITCTGVDDFVENNFQIDRLFQVVEGTVERRN